MDDAARRELAAQHLGLVRHLAGLVHRRVSDYVELDELIALGNLGLAEAAQRFDPSAGASFRTFAWYRVQGAIIDGCRRNTTLPRRVWCTLTALGASAAYLEAAQARAVAARDQAGVATTADKLREVKVALQAIRTMHHVALDAVPPAALVSDTPAPSDRLDRQQDAARLRAALDRLPDRERALIVAHYVDGQTLLDAGAALGLSKSWASRLHARAIDRLRELLADDAGAAPADPVSAPARTPRPGSP